MPFNPATAIISGWMRGSYGGDPWSGNASAGVSGDGSHALFGSGVAPSVGSAVGGFTPASFNGTTQAFAGQSLWDQYLTSSGGTISMLIMAASATADAGAGSRIGNPGLLCQDTGGTSMGLGYSTAGATIAIYDGAYQELTDPLPVGQWGLVQCKWDATNVYLRVNGRRFQSKACTGPAFSSGLAMKLGVAYDGTTRWTGDILDVILANTALSDATCNDLGIYVQDRYGLALGFTPPWNRVYFDMHDARRRRVPPSHQRFWQGPTAPASAAGNATLLQPNAPRYPDRHELGDRRRTHASRMLTQTALSPLPIPTDTTTFAQMRAVYPNEVRGRFFRATNQDHVEVPPYQPPVVVITPVALTDFPDSVPRPGLRAERQQAAVLPPPQIANPITPVALTDFPDTVPRPRFGAHLQLHVSSLQPQPERTIVFFDAEFPDAVRRPRLAPSAMRFHAFAPRPEQTVALGFQGRHPQTMRRPVFEARHQQSSVWWPFPLPDAPIIPVPIVTQDGVVTLLSARGSQVAILAPQSGAVSLLTARGQRVVVLDAQSGEVVLLAAKSGTVE